MKIETFKVEEWMNEYEKYSKYDLGNTTVNTLTLKQLFEMSNTDKNMFFENLSKQKMGYGYIKGNPELKSELSALYENISPEEIITTIGAAGANHLVFYSLVEDGDEVISVQPTYQQLYSIPESFNAKTKILHLTPKNKFLPDINELKSLITSKTKIICLNNPNNPSGSLIPEDLMKEIVEIAQEKNIYILCDEVYRELNQNNEKTLSIVDFYDKGISVCSFSKVFSLAGIRLGWIATKDKKVMELLVHHREYNMISCSVLDENVAIVALKNKDKILEANKKTLKTNLEILDNWINSQEHFYYVKPQAGTTALVYYNFDTTSKELCNRLAKEKGVFLTPGFCFETEHCFRVGYGGNSEVLQQGLYEISNFVKEYIK